jgi:alkaline phosphatase D
VSPIDRRSFLAATGVGVAAAALSGRPAAADPRADLFALGVASGDPTWSGVVLWTRLAPAPLDPAGGFGMDGAGPQAVRWRIGRSESGLTSGDRVDQEGTVTAVAERGYSVHVDVRNLRPATTYYYQFLVGDTASPVGRTRTAPAPGDRSAVRFAVINCQNLAGPDHDGLPTPMYLHGLDHLAARDDIDFVLYLGDYIYEFGRKAHIPPRAVVSIDDYRTRYGQYKLVPGLQEVHRRFPVYAVPDDHEFFDNVHGGALPAARIGQFNNGIEAFWEHLPVRSRPMARGDGSEILELTNYRAIRWGKLLDLFMIDVRQYATATDALGPAQWAKFASWLADSKAAWTSIGSGFGWSYFGGPGAWIDYPEQRAAVTDLLARRKAGDPRGFNPVLLSGDIHCGIVTHVRKSADFTSPLVATEFVNAPMGSGTTRALQPSIDPQALRKAYNKGAVGGWDSYRGYLSCTVTETSWTSDFFLTDDHLQPVGSVAHGGRWRLAAGAPVGAVAVL